MKKDINEKVFLRRMIKDSDVNGAKYFLKIKNNIKKSKLTNREKEILINKLEDTSGYTE